MAVSRQTKHLHHYTEFSTLNFLYIFTNVIYFRQIVAETSLQFKLWLNLATL